ncbi:MAG TPA: hypothetical protein VGO62_13795 [Myxococcota bacterium]
MMPLGSAVLLPSVRDTLDVDLRAALTQLDGVLLQPADETQAHITEAGENGLDLTHCPQTRDDCALQIAVLADVDYVVTFAVEEAGDGMLLRGGFLAVDGSAKRHIAGELTSPQVDNGVSLRAFVTRLVKGEGKAQKLPFLLTVEPAGSVINVDGVPTTVPKDNLVWLLPGDHALHIEAPHRAPVERTINVHPDGENNELVLALNVADTPVAFYAGVSVATLGGLLTVAAGSAAVVSDALLENGLIAHTDRGTALFIGRTSLGVAGAGVALLGFGTAAAAIWSEP